MDTSLLTTGYEAGNAKWQKPEKVAGWVFLGAAVGTGVYFWGTIAPFLVDMVFDTVKLGVGLGALFLLFLLATNKRIKAGLWYAGQRFFRSAAGIFVETDPIGIMEDYIRNTEQEAKKMDGEVAHVEGAHELVKRKMDANQQQMREYLGLAASAQRQGEKDAAEQYASRAAQLEDYNTRLQPMLTTTANVSLVMRQILKAALRQIDNSKFKVNLLKDEYNLVKRTSSGMRAAMNILRGDPDKKYFFDLATDRVAQDMAQKLGQIKQAMRYSQAFVKEMDIQNGVMSEKGQQLLERYQKGDFNALLDEKAVSQAPRSTTQASNDAFSKLLD
ncbi:PspA/IM30 family protein [Hymenobacter sp. 15J16-1T3B]|uniref:PspA/IM30 family protein n=1 Tax=Hymenobacter sp. 15J16-1T3B TaxID=2886941 RepID=UPI001D12C27D|nr:PspA/IM30 family protein [Hymenobacter sp. 15J16-1T3B]MCC3159042.1 PspA/IM30 family protein [Hymenobacter sp. 15J16-1T3B]